MSSPSFSGINGCYATGQSHQNNLFIQHADVRDVNIQVFLGKSMGEDFPDAKLRLSDPEAAYALFLSFYPGPTQPRLASRQVNDVPTTNGVHTNNVDHDHPRNPAVSQSSNGVPHDKSLLGSSWYDADLPLCVKRYLSPGSNRRVLDVLSQKERRKVNNWRNEHECGILFVRRSDFGESRSDWTTDLTLEIMTGIAVENQATQKYRPFVAHFCKQNADKKDWASGVTAVQDYISQILRNIQAETGSISGEHEHPNGRPQDILDDSTDRWECFKQCVIKTDAETIFVFLDNINCMFGKMNEGDFANFIDCLEKLRQESKSLKTKLKVMVTCSKKSPAIEKYLSGQEVIALTLEQPPVLRLQGGTSQQRS
ncbi:hypothetical protein PG996_005446 [Apiospora saccharicola]|uniref:Uncharacterized protein n=1 Tax=Apiospora saccharicola TaxID=335842 RepID=A0ABR1VLL2_9PEZI